MESLQWMLESGDRLTVPGLLATLLIFGALAFFRGWIVPGPIHKDCLEERDSARDRLEQVAARTETKLDQAEAKIESLRERRR